MHHGDRMSNGSQNRSGRCGDYSVPLHRLEPRFPVVQYITNYNGYVSSQSPVLNRHVIRRPIGFLHMLKLQIPTKSLTFENITSLKMETACKLQDNLKSRVCILARCELKHVP